uniref:Heterogeneous nuclear ribonucleoprotein 1 n=1 Tax=Rhizophora mucronata TaxID=61149 RepID=A0A2P2N7G6_RHIMU
MNSLPLSDCIFSLFPSFLPQIGEVFSSINTKPRISQMQITLQVNSIQKEQSFTQNQMVASTG